MDSLRLGRDAFKEKAWRDAVDALSAADKDAQLSLDDLERLALAAYLVSEDRECAQAWTRAHHQSIQQNQPSRAARCAFWQACGLLFRDEIAPAMGWIARGRRVLDDYSEDCAEKGWLIALSAMPAMFEGRAADVLPSFIEAGEIAERFDDADVLTFTRLVRGHSLVLLDQVEEGLALLDEVMVAVTSGEVHPILAGIAYCQVIAACQDIFDVRRAREWTVALSRWCESQPDLVPYRGNCLIHRCEIFQLQGAWPEAMETAESACELLAGPVATGLLGSAHYQLAEIYRLRGDLGQAEESYRRASQTGRQPEPGLSLLRLAKGQVDSAAATIRRMLNEEQNPMSRAKLLPIYVEIMLAMGNTDDAHAGTDELAKIASQSDAPFLHGLSNSALGAVLVAEGQPVAALDALKSAWRLWQEIDAPYEAARVRVQMALAYRELADADSAAMELDGARWAFQQLNAAFDLARVDSLSDEHATPLPGELSNRETEVLSLLATGKTNREIASRLLASEHTVARHVQNIFAKIDVSSRSAATAFAFEHGLV